MAIAERILNGEHSLLDKVSPKGIVMKSLWETQHSLELEFATPEENSDVLYLMEGHPAHRVQEEITEAA